MLTPTMKLNRAEISRQYAKDIEVSKSPAMGETRLTAGRVWVMSPAMS